MDDETIITPGKTTWPNGARARYANTKKGWGHVYINPDGSLFLMFLTGRKTRLRLEDIESWHDGVN
jgi:hypothetical protein